MMHSIYPAPLVIPPLRLPHKQTFILLHGRGSWAEKFGPALLKTPVTPSSPDITDSENSPPPLTLPSIFPHAKFVFPTAARTRAKVWGRALTHQWFDNWKLDPPATEREGQQSRGLRETTAYLHGLIRAEIEATPGGSASVVLGGLSQGCAATLISLLLWEGEPLAAAFGMCGWLPFCVRISELLPTDTSRTSEIAADAEVKGQERDVEQAEEFDPFGSDDDKPADPISTAVGWLREEIEVPRQSPAPGLLPFQTIPLFLGHGKLDKTVPFVLGDDARKCLTALGAKVEWCAYGELEHWYSGDMLADIAKFVHQATGW